MARLRDCYRLACASGKHRMPLMWLEWYAYGHLDDVQLAVIKIPHKYDFSDYDDWKEHPKILEYHNITGYYPLRVCAGIVVHTMEAQLNEDWHQRYKYWTDRPDYDRRNDIGWLYELNPNYLRYVGIQE